METVILVLAFLGAYVVGWLAYRLLRGYLLHRRLVRAVARAEAARTSALESMAEIARRADAIRKGQEPWGT